MLAGWCACCICALTCDLPAASSCRCIRACVQCASPGCIDSIAPGAQVRSSVQPAQGQLGMMLLSRHDRQASSAQQHAELTSEAENRLQRAICQTQDHVRPLGPSPWNLNIGATAPWLPPGRPGSVRTPAGSAPCGRRPCPPPRCASSPARWLKFLGSLNCVNNMG